MNKEKILLEAISEIAKEVIDFISASSDNHPDRDDYKENIDDICSEAIEKLSNEDIIDISSKHTFSIGYTFIDSNTNLQMVVVKDSDNCDRCDGCYYNKNIKICPFCFCGDGHYHFEIKII